MVNEVIHIKEEDLTPEERKVLHGENTNEEKDTKPKKEGFFSKFKNRVKCGICGKYTKSKTGFCASCRKSNKNKVEKM